MQDVLKIKEQRASFKKDVQHMCLYFRFYHSPKNENKHTANCSGTQHPNAFLIIETNEFPIFMDVITFRKISCV